ncbi:3-ketoacyl-CoA reductase [Schizopora paradoxa]|uniref:3-ketoacyl-CoA reductase n=1 Tax=Schizopora paradoxa TaxID=27342 RepID=A0A0H2REQ9_9AGAM|nr:3-ketoacyl-CoA reductase [Schizopora paradoxa]
MDTLPTYSLKILASVGALSLGTFVLKTLLVLLQTFVLGGKSLAKYASNNKEAWAVVTGATDGIGKEFAFQLAAAKYNIILVSRTQGRLDDTASEIGKRYGRSTRTIAVDFEFASDHDFNRIAQSINDLDIAILVNNVGRSHEMPVAFAETALNEQKAIIAINVNATLRVTSLVLNKMLARKRGLVLTLSSFAGVIPSPLLATYSGSKAFLQTWSDALQSELKGSGVDVECVSTYFVSLNPENKVSNMSRIRRASMLIPMPEDYVSAVLRKIGVPCGALWTGRPSTSTPFWSHSLLDFVIHCIGWKGAFIRYTLSG